MPRHVRAIEVGTHGKYVGFTLRYYETEEADHHLFSLEIGEDLAKKLLTIIEQIRYIENQVPSDRVRVGEHVSVRIAPPSEGG